MSQNQQGVVSHPTQPLGGRSRLNVSLREGSNARPGARLNAPTNGARRDRLIRAFLVIGDVRAACAWTWPGAFPEADPVAVLVRHDTPNVYTAIVVWYDCRAGAWACVSPASFLITTSRIWFARMRGGLGLCARLPCWALSPTSDRPGHRYRRGTSPRHTDGEPRPGLAHGPGAGPGLFGLCCPT